MKNTNLFKFLVISLLACPLFNSAMDSTSSFTKVSEDRSLSFGHPELVEGRRTGIEQEASDFEIYQLLSFAAKNDPKFYLPNELVHTIAKTACDITEEENIAIAHAIDKTQNLKKIIEEQNQIMQNLAEQIRALTQERKNLYEEGNYLQGLMEKNYLQALMNGYGKFNDEASFPVDAYFMQ